MKRVTDTNEKYVFLRDIITQALNKEVVIRSDGKDYHGKLVSNNNTFLIIEDTAFNGYGNPIIVDQYISHDSITSLTITYHEK